MRLEFSIVLFENEGYATARRNTGINEILASKAGDTGYVMDDDSYRIFTLDPYAWKWWLNPRLHRPDFCSCYSSSTESDCDNPAIQERIIKALEDWQKKYLRANETIKLISSGKHILYHCDVETVCGDAEIYCFDLSSILWRIMLRQRSSQGTLSLRMFRETPRSNAWRPCYDH